MPRPVGKGRLGETISGDLGVKSDEELAMAFPRPIKGKGPDVRTAPLLPYRKERMVGDSNTMFKREASKDSVL